MKTLKKFALLSCAALGLAACEGGVKQQLGLERSAPDEYAVVKRAPLEMPPDYSLRPPRPGAARPQEAEPGLEAQTAVFGTAQQGRYAPGDGESVLLQKAGATGTSPAIREQIDREAALAEPKNKPVAEKLLGWTTGDDEQPAATVVDPKAEAERLRRNAETGAPLDTGETPTRED